MKKLLSGALALVLCAALSGCGSTSGDEKSLVIGASITPHAEIIKNIQPDLEKMGYTVEIVEFSDYNKPNEALNDGQLDANSSTISIWQSGTRRAARTWSLPVTFTLSRWASIPRTMIPSMSWRRARS